MVAGGVEGLEGVLPGVEVGKDALEWSAGGKSKVGAGGPTERPDLNGGTGKK